MRKPPKKLQRRSSTASRAAVIEALVIEVQARLAQMRHDEVSALSLYTACFEALRWDLAVAMRKLGIRGAERMVAALSQLR